MLASSYSPPVRSSPSSSYTLKGPNFYNRPTTITRDVVLHATEPTIAISSDSHQVPSSLPLSLSRREAVGIGLCLSVFWDKAQATAEEGDTKCQFSVAPSGIQFCDKVIGTGPGASKGQLIKAHYVGKLQNGKIFDSSYNRGKPLSFRIGVGEVIKGWDQGILGGEGIPPMLAGGKRTLKLPPELGYGMRGAGCNGGSCVIPPNSVLVFDVEFVGKA